MLSANGSGVGLERVVAGKPVVHSNRRRPVKPREKRQLLQMICESVRTRDRGDVRGCERVTYFEIALARAYLSCVTPRGSGIVAERVIHPFPDFMSCNRSVVDGRNKGPRGFEVNEGVRLDARGLIWSYCGVLGYRVVETENTTVRAAGRIRGHHGVVEQKDRKFRRIDIGPFGHEQLVKNLANHDVEIHDCQWPTGSTEPRRKSLLPWQIHSDRRQHMPAEKSVIAEQSRGDRYRLTLNCWVAMGQLVLDCRKQALGPLELIGSLRTI